MNASLYDILAYFTHLRILTPAFADGFPLESKWQQVSSSLQDSSQYSVRSQHCYCLDGLISSFYFQFYDDHTKGTIYNWYHCHFNVPCFFNSLLKSIFSFWFPSILSRDQSERQSPLFGRFSLFSFLLTITRSGRLEEIREIRWYSKIPKNFVRLIF